MARNTISLVAKTTLITFLPLLAVVPLRAQNGNGNGQANGIVKGLTTCVLNGKKYDNCTPGMQKQSLRQAAANTRKTKRQAATLAGVKLATYDPAKGPDYFGTDSNYANSPLPMGSIGSIVPVFGGSGYTNPTVSITDAYGSGANAAATAAVDNKTGAIKGFSVTNPGSGYLAPVVTITDATGSGANARAVLTNITAGAGMRKFVDQFAMPPLATPTPCNYSGQGADCYEIWLVEYSQKMHTDLPPTKLRGYAQILPIGSQTFAPGNPSYLGPIIVAQRDKPVRITFRNKLNPDSGGDLFIPVDTTYMGAGKAPDGTNFRQNRATIHMHGGTTPWISDGTIHQWVTPANDTTFYPKGVSVRQVPDMADPGPGSLTFFYTNQQSARLMFYHDHALGLTRLNVYAGEAAGYLLQDPAEATLKNGGAITNPYTGQSVSIAANTIPDAVGIPLVIQDKTFVPSLKQLTAQDPSWSSLGLKFMPPAATDLNGNGALWFPHVYMPNQNPYDLSGANAMGRWDYGPWFWPPFTGLVYGPVQNPYCNPDVNGACTGGEPPVIPGTPNPSGTPESFMDTPVVNGKAYPTLTVPAAPVRFRILSVGNDRFLNLSLWVAATKDSATTAGEQGATQLCTDNSRVTPDRCTEVKMVPFNSAQNAVSPFPSWWYTITSNGFTFDDRAGGVPDPTTRGPAMIQIGTEGGFLPGPVVVKNQPINYVYNRRDIVVGNVNEKALLLGPAERADIIVDFSKFAGKTLILYNDSPAPVPAADPRLDYYTGNPDNTDTGGAPSTQPGYGPNTRTVMQIVVAGASAGSKIANDDYDPAILTKLQTALPAVFAASEDKILVPQKAYDPVYGTSTADTPGANLGTIQGTSLTFKTLDGTAPQTFQLEPKAIIEDFTTDYGRMNALLGVEIKNTNVTNQTSIPQGLVDPPTELVRAADPKITPIGSAADGTQLWKITHNGVDTHAMHFHMVNVQVVNRVGWDGAIRPPDPNELGFKDTVRMNPLEDIIIATRPIQLTNVPFDIPNSIRLMDPSRPAGANQTATGAALFTNVNPAGNPVTITNDYVNYGWEYVWHCHILGHEENDMMRALVIAVPPKAPSGLTATIDTAGVTLTWLDNSVLSTGFTVQRASDPGFTTGLVSWPIGKTPTGVPNQYKYTDLTFNSVATPYYYRVFATNTVGSTVTGYPTLTADSGFSETVLIGVPAATIADPTGIVVTLATGPIRAVLTWTDNAINEANYVVEKSINGSNTFTQIATLPANANTGPMTYIDTAIAAPNSYVYRVKAINGTVSSNYATSASVLVGPAAPSNLTGTATRNGGSDSVALTWADNATNESNFTVQRCTGTTATCGLAGATWANLTTTLTANTTAYTNTGAARNTTYSYRVRATNAFGASAWSNLFGVTTP